MKVLITGAAGMLGTDLQSALSCHDLVPTDIVEGCLNLDIANTAQVMRVVGETRPDLVLHTAAYTDVDGCERDPDKAYRINALGTWNLAAACAAMDIAIGYISTDFVFDGEKGEPYTEYDSPSPLSHYGASKLAGELHVRSLCPKHFIFRTAWLYGVHGKSFPRMILNAAKAGKDLRVVGDQFGSPTFTVDLASKIGQVIETPLYGTYHVTNSGTCSWYDFAKKTLSLAGINNVEVKSIKGEEWPSPTKRPRLSTLRHYALELQGKDDLRPWESALEEFISALGA